MKKLTSKSIAHHTFSTDLVLHKLKTDALYLITVTLLTPTHTDGQVLQILALLATLLLYAFPKVCQSRA
jgi:hypothetical protein